jgi:hypothetical protein
MYFTVSHGVRVGTWQKRWEHSVAPILSLLKHRLQLAFLYLTFPYPCKEF